MTDADAQAVPASPLCRSGVWWCNSHQREATQVRPDGSHRCDPMLGGILLPCNVVFAPVELIHCEPQGSPLCRVPGSPSVWMRHDLASNGVCARCGWALSGRAVRQEEEP